MHVLHKRRYSQQHKCRPALHDSDAGVERTLFSISVECLGSSSTYPMEFKAVITDTEVKEVNKSKEMNMRNLPE